MIFGVAIAFVEVWLAGKNAVAATVAGAIASLIAVGFLLFERESRHAAMAKLEEEIAAWQGPVRQWLGAARSGELLIADFLNLRERCHQNRQSRDPRRRNRRNAGGDSRPSWNPSKRNRARADAALASFLGEAGAEDEAQFQSRLRMFRKRQELAALLRDREAQISGLAGDPQAWPGELARVLEDWREIRRQRDEAIAAQSLASAERRSHRRVNGHSGDNG